MKETRNRPLSRGGHFESQGNKKLCFCPSSLALDERLDGQNLLFQQCVIKVYYLNLKLLSPNEPFFRADFRMPLFLNTTFSRKQRHGRRDEPIFRFPKKSPFMEIFRGFRRKSAYFNTSKGGAEEITQITDTNGQDVMTSWRKAQKSPQSLQPRPQIQPKEKLSLEELKKTSPPAFQEFEAALASQELDEEIALLLWEDIFKPLSSHFESLQDDSGNWELTVMYMCTDICILYICILYLLVLCILNFFSVMYMFMPINCLWQWPTRKLSYFGHCAHFPFLYLCNWVFLFLFLYCMYLLVEK